MTTVGPVKATGVTAREAEVLALLARRLTNVEIADELFISVRTVESHVSALLRKLQLVDRRSLARYGDAAAAKSSVGHGTVPTPVTAFIGRTVERTELIAALSEQRMVTATGPGGVGKTRLALSVAGELVAARRDGGWFVDLVQVSDPAMVVAAVAEVVGVPEQRSTSVDAALVAVLAARDAVVVVDNCEHVLEGVRHCVEQIVAGCPNVTVLATSRTRLMLPYERVFAVPGLSVTDNGGDAVALFTARIGAITGDVEGVDTRRVAALCRALDGSALAIELAAARYPTLGLDGLQAGLDERLRLLSAGTPTHHRHRSLRDAIGWSYQLLAPNDQTLLRTVAVFASWFDVDAASTVAGRQTERTRVADSLARLADDSLLVVDRGDPTRYRALETIRQYGVEQLDTAGDLDIVRASHHHWCRTAITTLAATQPDDAWRGRFDLVVDDIRAALVWTAGDARRRSEATRLAADLGALLYLRGRLREAQHRYEQAAELAPTAAGRLDNLRLAARTATSRYAGDDALRLLQAAADLAMSLGDRSGAATDLAWMSIYIDRATGIMAVVPTLAEAASLRDAARATSDGSNRAEAAIATATAFGEPDDPAVLEWSQQAADLARRAGDATLESAALDQLCVVHLARNDLPEAVRLIHERDQVIRTLAVDAGSGFEHSDFHLMASEVYLAAGDLIAAGDHADALARLSFFRGDDHLALSRRIKVDALAGHFDDVVSSGERFRLGWERAGRPIVRNLAPSAHAMAMVHGMLGNDEHRVEWLDITVALGASPELLAGCTTGWAPTFDALLALHRDEPSTAVQRLAVDLDDPTVFGVWRTGLWRPWYAALWAEAAVLDHHPDAAARIEHSRNAVRANPIATTIVDRAIAIADGDHHAVEQCGPIFAELDCEYQRRRTHNLTPMVH